MPNNTTNHAITYSNTTQVEPLTNSFNDPILKKNYGERSRKLRAEQVFNQITLKERFSSWTFCFRVLHNQVFPTGAIKSECNRPDLFLHVLIWMGFTRANVVVFGQSVLYWKVSVLRTETAKIVTHLNGFLQTEKVINFFSTSNFSHFETSSCSEKPNQTLFFPKQKKSFFPYTYRYPKKRCLEKSQKLRWKAHTYTCKYYKTFSQKDIG